MNHCPAHAAATLVLAVFAASAAAAPSYSVYNCAQSTTTPVAAPLSISDTCVYPKSSTQTMARADTGSVGAYASTMHTYADDTDGVGSAGARFYTDEIVISKLPSAGSLADLVYIALRFDVHGRLDVPDFGGASAQVVATLGTISGNTSFRNNGVSVTKEVTGYTVIEDDSAGDVIDMVLETNRLLVSVGSTIQANLSINVATFVRQLYEATSDFSNSATFAMGRDVFAFYDANGNPVSGYTANAGDYIVNNRFGEAPGTAPEPATLALFGLALAGISAARRYRIR